MEKTPQGALSRLWERGPEQRTIARIPARLMDQGDLQLPMKSSGDEAQDNRCVRIFLQVVREAPPRALEPRGRDLPTRPVDSVEVPRRWIQAFNEGHHAVECLRNDLCRQGPGKGIRILDVLLRLDEVNLP